MYLICPIYHRDLGTMDEHGYLRIVGRLKVWSKPESESVRTKHLRSFFTCMSAWLCAWIIVKQSVIQNSQSVSQSLSWSKRPSVKQSVSHFHSQSVNQYVYLSFHSTGLNQSRRRKRLSSRSWIFLAHTSQNTRCTGTNLNAENTLIDQVSVERLTPDWHFYFLIGQVISVPDERLGEEVCCWIK